MVRSLQLADGGEYLAKTRPVIRVCPFFAATSREINITKTTHQVGWPLDPILLRFHQYRSRRLEAAQCAPIRRPQR